ncbi:thiamine/thiamine pyrophosphate ABC transporter permease ThiP [Roseobacter sinensis]|uniref:Thiamine/thiamine pyrophosphate ABC transporter permease ThiP n=1 Tax=Roseobacter sinensis TaxID=2931391 RepID=A0ABT3B8A6_9RHOB|nr:thiamine/thiamine pyrophosphate ABC transporter permease ThiP [Roseobacter sp. WL0113]MCV3269807.1 thiamine/thiamine pyrophosphate ABC transporter permease ThiP [Roseobacter sp. WL0113]
MAPRAQPIIGAGGVAAGGCVVAVVLASFVGLGLKAEVGRGIGPAEWAAIRFTVVQAVLSALLSVAFAIPLARALARRRFPGRGVLITLLGAPFILPVIVAVLGLLAVFGRTGWLNTGLGALGLPELSIYGLHGVVLAHVFFNLPLATRLLLQGWQSIPAERFRLAAQLNLPPRMVFRTLEWPLLKQVAPGAAALIFVICLTSFAVALTLGGGPRATTIELAIYQAFRFDFDLARASLLSLIQLGLAGGAALLALWVIPNFPLSAGLDRALTRWDARGGGQAWADAAIITFGSAFLLLPLFAILLAGLQGLPLMPPVVWQTAGNSLWVAILSIAVLLLIALPMAGWISTRQRGSAEAIGLIGLSASPLMIGTGWFILINPIADPVPLALPVTALINALMALPFALRILVPPMRDVLGAYDRLARSLGLRGWAAWRWLVLPRLRAQVGFAAGLTGALSVGDLGVIALFADPDRATLPLQMYRLMGAYRTEAAAGAALVLLAMALGLFWLCDKGGRWRVEA